MRLLAISFATIQAWISTIGYPALFGLLFACGLGLPLPEDIPLVISGALIQKGSMTWLWAGICAWCGIIGGDCMLYMFGRKFGLEITRVPMIGKHVTKERIKQVEAMFEKYGVGVVGVGRLFAGIRGAMVVCAGAIRYNFITFIIADGIAALVSGGLWMWLGHWLGSKLTEDRINHYKHHIMIGMIVVVVLFIVWIIFKKRHKEEVLDKEMKVFEKTVAVEKKVVDKITPKPKDASTTASESGGNGDAGVAATEEQAEEHSPVDRDPPHA
jgi:membrane protein DedA with SNARE-associated domain